MMSARVAVGAVVSAVLALVLVAGVVPVAVASAVAGGAPFAVSPSLGDADVAVGDEFRQLPEFFAMSAVEAQRLAFETGEPVEDMSQRTPYVAMIAQPDGYWRALRFFAPEWSLEGVDPRERSSWVELDVALVREGGRIVPAAHAEMIEINAGGAVTDWVVRTVDDETGDVITLAWEGYLPSAVVEGSRATFAGVEPGIDFVIEVTPVSYEQFWVVHDREALDRVGEFGLDFVFDGGGLVERDGAVHFVTDAGETIANIPPAVAWDARTDVARENPLVKPAGGTAKWHPLAEREEGDTSPSGLFRLAAVPGVEFESSAVTVTLDERGGGQRVAVGVDEAWLNDPDTQYPIVVDPAVYLTILKDTYVRSGSSSNYDYTWYMLIGIYSSTSPTYRSIINVDASALHDKTVQSASVGLWNYHSWSCTAKAWRAYDSNIASSSTGWPGPSFNSSVYTQTTFTRKNSSSCPAAYAYLDLTAHAQIWATETGQNTQAIQLIANSERYTSYWKRFHSMEASSKRPYFYVVYNTRPDTPTNVQVLGMDIGVQDVVVTDPYPVLQADVTDDDGGLVYAVFRIYDDQGVLKYTLDGSEVASGEASILILDSPLDVGVPYTVEVAGADGVEESATPFTSTFTLTYDKAAPDVSSAGVPEVPTICDDELDAVVGASPAPCAA